MYVQKVQQEINYQKSVFLIIFRSVESRHGMYSPATMLSNLSYRAQFNTNSATVQQQHVSNSIS